MHQCAAEIRRVVVVLVVLVGLVSCGGATEPVLEPAEWDFGTIPATMPVEQKIAVHNPGRRQRSGLSSPSSTSTIRAAMDARSSWCVR